MAREGADLEFSEQMAESMTLDQLKDLSRVLMRIIQKRNEELVSLQLRRDELTHERDFRRATVDALIRQVDKSQYVKEEKKREKEKQKQRRRSGII